MTTLLIKLYPNSGHNIQPEVLRVIEDINSYQALAIAAPLVVASGALEKPDGSTMAFGYRTIG